MKIIGLTGTIASGKSLICQLLKERGFKVFESDAASRIIIYRKDIVNRLHEEFPSCFKDRYLDKRKLSQLVFSDTVKLRKLESIILPDVEKQRDQFIKENKAEEIIFIEAPLLFEAGYDKICNKIIVVITDLEILKQRALLRENMTKDLLEKILNNQISDDDKKNKSDYIIYNKEDVTDLVNQLENIILEIKK